MTDRTRNDAKDFSQDAIGFVFCLVGGFLAVSIVLFLLGQESKPSVRALTTPVIGLVNLLGSTGALLFSAGLAALGTLLFLRTTSQSAARPFFALAAFSIGLALILGAFGNGGALGAWFGGLVSGMLGRALGVGLGLALAWLGWTLLVEPRPRGGRAADAMPHLGFSARHEAAAGVSPAEAALLVTETRAPAPRPAPKRAEPAPTRDESIRPYTPAPVPKVTPLARPAAIHTPPPPPQAVAPAEPAAPPPAPSWEADLAFEAPAPELASEGLRDADAFEEAPRGVSAAAHDDEPAAIEDDEISDGESRLDRITAGLEARLVDAPELDEEAELDELEDELEGSEVDADADVFASIGEEDSEDEDEEEAIEPEEPSTPAPAPALTRPAWEQIGLFDEESETEEEAEPAPRAAAELTPSFDFEPEARPRHVHEPELAPRALAPTPPQPAVRAPKADPDPAYTLKPAAPQPEPKVVGGEDDPAEEDRSQLVFEAGCAILEQNRVAVSMLERRFGIDFDEACRVLDELQEAGLIGPYMGGRSRDILLTREEWLAHAPHAS